MNLAQRDRNVIWHPFTPQKSMTDPLPVVRGEGTLLFDDRGHSYIDAISSWWVNLHGHAHPYIAEKIYEQARTLEQVIFAGFTHEPAVRLAERLLPRLPGTFSRIFYSDNGSTSTEVAIKMAIQFWWNQGRSERRYILALRNSYHGDTFGAMSVSERSVFTMAFREKLFEVLWLDAPAAGFDPHTCELPWDQIACFIYEPLVQGAGGMHIYSAEAMDGLLQHCREHQIVCIADEVMTGFGRTGKWFASEYLKHSPDLICLSKGLTGGTMALGATAVQDSIYQAFVSDHTQHTFFHGHSFTANPLACTAALASLDLLERTECQAAIQRIAGMHQAFAASLTGLEKSGKIKQVRLLGTILAFEVNAGKDEYTNTISGRITTEALGRGVYIRPLGNTVYLMPPYCITDAELQRVYDSVLDILEKL